MIERLIDVALGRTPADVVLKNGTFVNVFTGQVQRGDIAIACGKVAGIGAYEGEREYDIRGKVAVPGLIDAHVHIESAQLSPEEFARLVMPRGTTTVIADPHEIVNVCGVDGAQYIARAAQNTPLEVKLMLPSCVPANTLRDERRMPYGGADCGAAAGGRLLRPRRIHERARCAEARTRRRCKSSRARAPRASSSTGTPRRLEGEALNAYIAAGISTDHECACAAEAAGKGLPRHVRPPARGLGGVATLPKIAARSRRPTCGASSSARTTATPPISARTATSTPPCAPPCRRG